MKRFLQRVCALVLTVVLMTTALPMTAVTVTARTSTAEQPLMAFVPLDNRPVCVDRVLYAAGAAGFDIRLPEEDLYRTYLDNQGVNANGTQHGDGTAIAAWLWEMEEAGCDYYIIHLDQMFSGGLVGSRYPDATALTDAEYDILNNCLIPLSNDTNNHVYFVDTVMRLASTGSYKGYEIGEYTSFRKYAAQERWVLNPDNFYTTDYDTSVKLIDGIKDFYQIGVNYETLTFNTTADEWNAALTQAQIDEYHAFRRRKLDIINLMMQFANRNAVYIIGVDDASPGNTIQSNEINFIKKRMEALGIDYALSADTDSSGLMAIARLVNDYYEASPTIRVRYYGNKADVAADDYDIGTLRENVSEHIRCLNGVEVYGDNADIEVLVLTKADTIIRDTGVEDATYTANIHALVAQANANIAADKPTIVIEASTEMNYLSSWVKGLPNLQDELLENVDISRLLGYSNWNTVGNSIGIALGTGVSRYTYLAYADSVSDAANTAFMRSMTYTYIKDITYNARNKHQNFTWTFQYWITNKAGGSGWNNGNFYTEMVNYEYDYVEDWELCGGEHYVNNALEWCMMFGNDPTEYTGCGQHVLNTIMAGEIYTKLGDDVQTAAVDTVTLDKFHCPWYRQFEISFEITPSLTYYATSGDFVTNVPAKQTASSFAERAVSQYGASAVAVTDLSGATVTAGYVGTGFVVSITANGTTSTYTVVITGEVNGDGKTDTTDVRVAMLNVMGEGTFSEAQLAAADLNGNGTITSTDARRMLQRIAG